MAKKAYEVVILDMKEVSNVTDFFVIASGTSSRQIQAIADHVQASLVKRKSSLWHLEGYSEATWIVLDYGDVITHVFLQEKREFYNLERLWSIAPRRTLEAGREGVTPIAPKKK